MSRPAQYLVLVLLALIWGSSFILMKRGLVYFESTELAACRMSVAMIVLLPIALRRLRLIRGKLAPLFLIGLIGNTIPAFLFALAQTVIPSSLSGMLNSLTSLFTLLAGVAFFRMRPWPAQAIGVVLALVGTLGLIGFAHLAELTTYGRYSLLVVAASCCYGIAVNIVKSHLHDVRPQDITSLAFLLTAPFLLFYLLFSTDFVRQMASEPESRWGLPYVILLGVLSTSVAVIIFNRLIMASTPVFAASVTYLIPVVAIGWGVVDGESVAVSQVGYLIVILAGVSLINLPRGALGRLARRPLD